MPGKYEKNNVELTIEVLFVVVSNLFGIFGVVRSFRSRIYNAGILGICCILSSVMYHIGDTTQARLFGMNPGQWHRLDNIFIISTVQYIWICLFDTRENIVVRFHTLSDEEKEELKKDEKFQLPDAPYFFERKNVREALFIGFFCFTVWCQEYAPWNEFYTFFPIALAFFVCYPFRYYLCTPPYYRPVYDYRQLALGMGCLFVGLFFFVKGLDDGNDYLRLNHGMWHIFMSLAVFHIMGSKRFKNPRKLWSFHLRKKPKKDEVKSV